MKEAYEVCDHVTAVKWVCLYNISCKIRIVVLLMTIAIIEYLTN